MRERKNLVTVRIIGGLGNQLFSYAAARRLALANDADLRIDHISGLHADGFQRKYALHHFNISQERIIPKDLFVRSRYYRGLLKVFSERLPFSSRPFVVEKGNDFDGRLIELKLRRDVFIQGYWQSEMYFKDIEPQIREELRFRSVPTAEALDAGRRVDSVEAVGVHVRRLQITNPLPRNYYAQAVEYIMSNTGSPHFYIFSDHPGWAEENLSFDAPVTYVSLTPDDGSGWMDMWLMSRCKHFIIANSTFSWWGAWLSRNPAKVVVYPAFFANWGHVGLMPDRWIPMQFNPYDD